MSDHKSRTRTINNGHHKIMKNYLTASGGEKGEREKSDAIEIVFFLLCFSGQVTRGIFSRKQQCQES
jgi:hypothetical protein